MSHVLIVTPQPGEFQLLEKNLGENVSFTENLEDAFGLIQDHQFNVLVVDGRLSAGSPFDLIKKAVANQKHCNSIMLLEGSEVEQTIEATNAGVRHLFDERPDPQALLSVINRYLLSSQLDQQRDRLIDASVHDLNNVLNTIGFIKEMPADAAQDDSPAAQLIEAENKIKKLVLQLTEFARQRDARPEVIDLQDSIQTLEPLLRRQIDYGVRFEIESEPALICVDPVQLKRLIYMLLVSVREFTKDAASLKLSVGKDLSEDIINSPANLIELSGSSKNTGVKKLGTAQKPLIFQALSR